MMARRAVLSWCALQFLLRFAQGSDFVQVYSSGEIGTGFAIGDDRLYVHGFNQHGMMTHAVSDKPFVTEVLDDAKLHGFNVMRTWAFSDGVDEWNALQPFPGIYDEVTFRALDYVLAECRSRDIRVILAITNHWEEYGGATQYVSWVSGSGSDHRKDFYEDAGVKRLYRGFVQALLRRRNVYTGKRYMDDEYILAWDLINEPRVEGDASGDVFQAWVEEMSAYVKSIDKNHLVTTGSEGFFGRSTPELEAFNPPGTDWANHTGVDFVRNHNISSIDFAVFHLYPDAWLKGEAVEGECNTECATLFSREYIEAHLASGLRKPVLLEEVGKKAEGRDAYFQAVFDVMHEDHVAGGTSVGQVIWQLSPDSLEDHDDFAVYLPAHSETGQIFRAFASRVADTVSRTVERGRAFTRWLRERLTRPIVALGARMPLAAGQGALRGPEVAAAAAVPNATLTDLG